MGVSPVAKVGTSDRVRGSTTPAVFYSRIFSGHHARETDLVLAFDTASTGSPA